MATGRARASSEGLTSPLPDDALEPPANGHRAGPSE